MQNRMVLMLLRPIFCEKLKVAPSNVWISKFGRKISLNFGEDLFFYFWRPPDFGRKKPLNFGFQVKNQSQFRQRLFFFGDHLILGGKNLRISELSEKFCLNFRTNRVKLIQEQWKFGSRSFSLFSLFQNSPPLFQILATRLCIVYHVFCLSI